MIEILKNYILFFWYRLVGMMFLIFPIRKNRFVFQSFFGKGYSDNPKYILEEIRTRNIENIELIWIVKDARSEENFPPEVKKIKRFTLKELYYLYTAQVWVDNSRKHFGVFKRKGQFYVQTWHGGLGFKKIERGADLGALYQKSARHDSKLIDVMLSGSKWQTELCKTQFWYDGFVLESGLPREDIWFQKKDTKVSCQIKRGYLAKKKYVLYAPTFRSSGDLKVYNIDFKRLLFLLEQHWGGEWVALIRLHPSLSEKAKDFECGENIIDATNYPDINQLILECDLFISDYSSCVLDSIWANKPSIIYAPDILEYESERGFLISPREYPLPLAENNEELMHAILSFNHSMYQQSYKEFKKHYGVVDTGRGSKTVVDYILREVSD